jgi:hypothetical protein
MNPAMIFSSARRKLKKKRKIEMENKKYHPDPRLGAVFYFDRGRGCGFETATFVAYEEENPEDYYAISEWFSGEITEQELVENLFVGQGAE